MGSAVLLRAVCSTKGWIRAVIPAELSGGGFVFIAIGFGLGVEELGDKPLLIAVEVTHVGKVLLCILFESFHG